MSFPSKEHFQWVDIIKAVSIIAVVFSHIEHPFKDYPLIPVASLLYGI